MKLKLPLLLFFLLTGLQSFSQNVTGTVMGTQFSYTALSEVSHEFSFTTYFSIGSGTCPSFTSAISFSNDTMFVKATYNICGFWPQLGCVRNDVVQYNSIIPSNIQHIIMSTDVITCEMGDPVTVENVYNHTYDVNLSTSLFTDTGISIYPNPANQLLTIGTKNNTPIDQILVTDLLGKKVIEQNTNTSTINIEGLQQGMYIIRVHSGVKKW